jgi:hypothetical protein
MSHQHDGPPPTRNLRNLLKSSGIANPCCLADQIEEGVSSRQTQCWACARQLAAEPKRCASCNTAVYCNLKCCYKDYELHKGFCVNGRFTGVAEMYHMHPPS